MGGSFWAGSKHVASPNSLPTSLLLPEPVQWWAEDGVQENKGGLSEGAENPCQNVRPRKKRASLRDLLSEPYSFVHEVAAPGASDRFSCTPSSAAYPLPHDLFIRISRRFFALSHFAFSSSVSSISPGAGVGLSFSSNATMVKYA